MQSSFHHDILSCHIDPGLPPALWTETPIRRDMLAMGEAGFGGETAGLAASSKAPADAGVSLAGRSILLVEDELMLALDVETALNDAGAEVIGPIDSLRKGLDLLDREPVIDAAILDIDLHGKDVFPIAEKLRTRGVPFLFHTGHGDRAALGRHFENVTVCIKPMLSERLLDAVRRLLN